MANEATSQSRNKPAKKVPARKRSTASKASGPMTRKDVLQWLERRGTKQQIKELDRYGISATEPFGVTVGALKKYAKEIGTDHCF